MRAIISIFILCIIPLAGRSQNLTLKAEFPVEQIKISGNIHLILEASDSVRLQFETVSIPEKLGIDWTETKLTLKTRTELTKTPAINLKLYYTSLSNIEITRGARVQSADTIKSQILTIRTETGGKAEFPVCADSISARVNQGGDIILSGHARSQLITAYTVGNYLGFELVAEQSWIKAASGAQVKVNSSGLLNANATSKAFVAYLGNPEKKEFKTSVGGEITPQKQ